MASNDFEQCTENSSNKNENSPQDSPLLKARQVLYDSINTALCSQNPFFMEQEQNSSYKRGVVYLLRHIDNKAIACEKDLLEAMNQKVNELKSEVFNNIVQAVTRAIESDLPKSPVDSPELTLGPK